MKSDMNEQLVQKAADVFHLWLAHPVPDGLTEAELVEAWRRACMESGRVELAGADVIAAGKFGFADGVRLARGARARMEREQG